MSEQTCAQRIQDQQESRNYELGELFKARDNSQETEDGDDPQESLDSFPLAITTINLTTVDISTGGPADSLEIEWANDGTIIRVTYIFQDWYDGARSNVEKGSHLYRYAQEVIENWSDLV